MADLKKVYFNILYLFLHQHEIINSGFCGVIISDFFFTRNDVSESDGCHCDEAKVEGLEKRPIFPNGENDGADAQKQGQKGQGHEGS